MKLMKLKTMPIILVTMTCSAFIASAQQVPLPNPTRQQIRVVSYSGDLAALLAGLAPSYEVTIGFEADSGRPQRAVTIEVKDGSIRDVLDAIVKNRPEYQWREVEGVFEVFPVSARSPLLDTTIMSFEVNNSGWRNASSILMGLPEVRERMAELRMQWREPEPSSNEVSDSFSLHIKNVTLRQALNEMATKSGRRFWHYSESAGTSKSFSIAN